MDEVLAKCLIDEVKRVSLNARAIYCKSGDNELSALMMSYANAVEKFIPAEYIVDDLIEDLPFRADEPTK